MIYYRVPSYATDYPCDSWCLLNIGQRLEISNVYVFAHVLIYHSMIMRCSLFAWFSHLKCLPITTVLSFSIDAVLTLSNMTRRATFAALIIIFAKSRQYIYDKTYVSSHYDPIWH